MSSDLQVAILGIAIGFAGLAPDVSDRADEAGTMVDFAYMSDAMTIEQKTYDSFNPKAHLDTSQVIVLDPYGPKEK